MRLAFSLAPVTSLPYRGRIAPSPTGHLHLGHARTFWTAYQRSVNASGTLILRNDDLDQQRSRPHYVSAMIEDLHWLGIRWSEGPAWPDAIEQGSFGPYAQSARGHLYRTAFEHLKHTGAVYPCICSRKDLHRASAAPHAEDDDEPLYPGTCRSRSTNGDEPRSWRFKVPDGEVIDFIDQNFGPQRFIAGEDFGDFLVMRRDGVPSYQLACVVDDAHMQITEVVRGADLLKSTARQILLQRALGYATPTYFHCDLMRDENGERLAKRHDALSLRALRQQARTPQDVIAMFAAINETPMSKS